MLSFIKIQEKDIQKVQDLAHEIWFDHYPGIISNEQIDYMLKLMYSEEVIKKEIREGFSWDFILFDSVAIGFVACSFDENEILKLNKLYIKVNYHGKRIGQQTLAFVENKAHNLNAKKICLTVNKMNIKAITAYKKYGFEIEKAVITKIGNGYVMDDYIMCLDLGTIK